MLGMHLARVQIDPDIKSKGMGNNKKMVLFASSEVRNMIIWGSYMIKNLLLPKTLNVGGGGVYMTAYMIITNKNNPHSQLHVAYM